MIQRREPCCYRPSDATALGKMASELRRIDLASQARGANRSLNRPELDAVEAIFRTRQALSLALTAVLTALLGGEA